MKFEILHKDEVIETKELGEGSYKIGRIPTCDIVLKSPQVSKQHALLVIKGEKAAIVDVGSSNGVFVNGILVRKQRVNPNDEVNIGEYKIRIAVPPKPTFQSRPIPQPPPIDDGNLARNLSFGDTEAEAAPSAITPQEKLILLMDQKILLPFYGLMKSIDWRMLLLSILGLSLVSAVLLSVIPIVRWGKNITNKEALARAHTVIRQTVRENYRIIAKTNDFTRLTVEAAEAEQGILECLIIDPKSNTVLAPAKLLNKPVEDIYALIAIKKITDDKEDVVSVERDNGIFVVAQPVYVFSQEEGDRVAQAIVLADFEVPTKVYSTFEPLTEAALFAILMSLLAYFLIFKMFTYPVIRLQEQLDAALKGEEVAIVSEAKFAEMESLATVMNFSISRLRQAGGGVAQPVVGSDAEAEDEAFQKAIEEFDQVTSDAVLLLDKDKRVRFVGKTMEDLVSMRNQYAVGQNISDACKDQSFAGTTIDLAERVFQTLGQSQSAQLDINGVNRSMAVVAHKNSGGEIRFVLVSVKLGGGG